MRNGSSNRSTGWVGKLAASTVLACVFGSVTAVSASAHAVPTPVVPDYSDVNTLAVQVEGVISSRCALGSGRNIDFGDLNRPALAVVTMRLDCNLPFVLRLNAVNGVLAHAQMPGGQGGYSGSVPYGMDIDVPLLNPSLTRMGGVYSGAQLRAGVSLDSDRAIAAGGATLKFSTRGSNNDLLAGQYSETVSVTIQPKM